MISCFLTAKPNLHIIIYFFFYIILTLMLGIYNYLCTILDVHHCRPSMYASRFVGF